MYNALAFKDHKKGMRTSTKDMFKNTGMCNRDAY